MRDFESIKCECGTVTTVSVVMIMSSKEKIEIRDKRRYFKFTCRNCKKDKEYLLQDSIFSCNMCEAKEYDYPDNENIKIREKEGKLITEVSCECGMQYCIPTSSERLRLYFEKISEEGIGNIAKEESIVT